MNKKFKRRIPASDNHGNLNEKKILYFHLYDGIFLNFKYFGLILLYGCGLNVKFFSAGNVSISGHIEALGVPRS